MAENKLVIFDCDGVLVDSEPISSSVLAAELRALGVPLSDEEAMRIFKGGKLSDAFNYAQKFINVPVPEDIEQIYREKCRIAFEERLQPMAGVKQMLADLKLPRCVASNGPRHKIAANLILTELNGFFGDDLYSAYDVQKWKPEPDLFFYAADQMKFDSKNCVVVEDSVHGVEAARAAGMQVFGYAPDNGGEELKAAGAMIFHDMKSLGRLLLN